MDPYGIKKNRNCWLWGLMVVIALGPPNPPPPAPPAPPRPTRLARPAPPHRAVCEQAVQHHEGLASERDPKPSEPGIGCAGQIKRHWAGPTEPLLLT